MLVALIVGASGLASSCIDKTPGLDVQVQSATIEVMGVDPDAAISIALRVRVHVGTHALDGRTFILPQADLFVDGAPVAQLNLDRPAGFGGTLEQGQTENIDIVGTAPAGAFTAAGLCGAEVDVVLEWRAQTIPDDPLVPGAMEFGTAVATTSDVICR